MTEHDWLMQRFAEHQGRLTALAYQMLGSRGDAEDAVQEAWLRVSRADTGQVENPAGWLTTVVARVLRVPKTCASWPDTPLDVDCSARAACQGMG
jgi:DNA-directed RNA polymerase specialized sigma24 family protein